MWSGQPESGLCYREPFHTIATVGKLNRWDHSEPWFPSLLSERAQYQRHSAISDNRPGETTEGLPWNRCTLVLLQQHSSCQLLNQEPQHSLRFWSPRCMTHHIPPLPCYISSQRRSLFSTQMSSTYFTYWPSPACSHTRVPWISQSFYTALLGPLDKRNRFHSSAEKKKIICFPWSRVWRPCPRGPLGHSPSAPADSLLHPPGSRRTCRPCGWGTPAPSLGANYRALFTPVSATTEKSSCALFCAHTPTANHFAFCLCVFLRPQGWQATRPLYSGDTEPTPSRSAWRFMGVSWTNDNNMDSCCCFMESVSQWIIKAK